MVAPFAINGLTAPDSHLRTDFGISLQVSVPLDREAVDECKNRARAATARAIAETDKAQLDYQMVRALKCAELIRGGAFLNPASPYAALCADVIARGSDGVLRTGTGQVVAVTPAQGTQRPSSSSTSSSQSSSQTSGASEPRQTKVSQIPQLPSLQP